jgi:hypothetical protein
MESTIGLVPNIIEWRIVLCGYLSALFGLVTYPLKTSCQEQQHYCPGLLRWASWSMGSRPRKCPFRVAVALGRLLSAQFRCRNIPDKASTATQAVISLCTANGTLSTKSLILSTACASTIAPLFLSLLAAKFRKVEIA